MESFDISLFKQDNNQSNEIRIINAKTILGRGGFLEIVDKKVSRNHAVLRWEDNGLTLESTHVNPCYVNLCKSTKQKILRNGGSVRLNDGDSFSLLQDMHIFKVSLKRQNAENTKGSDVTTKYAGGDNDTPLLQDTDFEVPYEPLSRSEQNSAYDRRLCTENNHDTTSEMCQTSFAEKSNLEGVTKSSPQKLTKILRHPKYSDLQDTGSSSKKRRKLPVWMLSNASKESTPSKKPACLLQKTETKKVETISLPDDVAKGEDWFEDTAVTGSKIQEHTKSCAVKEVKQTTVAHSGNDLPDHGYVDKMLVAPVACTETQVKNENRSSEVSNSRNVSTSDEHETKYCVSPASNNSSQDKCDALVENVDHPSTTSDTEITSKTDNNHQCQVRTSSTVTSQMREPCAFGQSCYRRNPVHFEEFSHPGDSDYVLPSSSFNGNDDDRPECEYGLQCYRKNPIHKQQFKHTRRMPPKRAATRQKKDDDDDESDGDDYDINDSFINDNEEEEESNEDEDSEWKPSQGTKKDKRGRRDRESGSESSEDIDDLVADAKDFTRNKNMWKT